LDKRIERQHEINTSAFSMLTSWNTEKNETKQTRENSNEYVVFKKEIIKSYAPINNKKNV
jgi:hypothetical protein